MKKNLLKQLVAASFKQNTLDQKTVLDIADRLNRKELKGYIKALKQAEKARRLMVFVPSDELKKEVEDIATIFPDKKLIVQTDPSLLLGLRVVNNDDIVEMNLQNNLDAILTHLEEHYD